jgi:signal transduction histidine kinase
MHREMISGKKLSDIWPEDVVKKIMGERGEQGFSASSEVQSFSLPFSNGAYESRLSPIIHKEALLVIRDVTNQTRLENMKSDFINRASHELRTPLTTTILMTELIQQGGTKEELDEYWRTLKSELNRQKNLIDTLLMAGRFESGAIKLEAAPMDLIPVLRESVQAIMPIAYKKKISIHLDVIDESLSVMGEKGGLQQVFINFINNAVKFSPEGSTAEVVVRKVENEALISIIDHGLGIPSDAIPHLFERFYRAKNVTIAEIPGSGIGLYVVKSIVNELGGTIEVESELNKGTTFIIHLRQSPQRTNSRLIL